MKDAVIYARYSSDKQDEASIDAQVRACREYAASKGYAVLEVYADEAVSGKGSKTASRKAYQKLLRDVNKGRFDTILIHKYDRVARNLGEHVNLEKKLKDRAVELIAVAQDFGSSAEAKIMKTLMWSLSEYYLDNLSSETKKGHRETAMKAKHNGGYAPFGYDVVNQEYVVNELEAGLPASGASPSNTHRYMKCSEMRSTPGHTSTPPRRRSAGRTGGASPTLSE